MATGSDKVVALRRLLDERHPAARPRTTRLIPTGVPKLDDTLSGGLRTGALTEFVSGFPSTGSQTSLGALLLSTRLARQRLALVDAGGAFDYEGLDDDGISHLVWVRCKTLGECWRAADLVARDPNYAVTVIDVRGRPIRELMRTKDSIWVRLQRAAEHAETAVLIQSDTSIVPNAFIRVAFDAPLPQGMLTEPRDKVIQQLAPRLQRTRGHQREITA